MGRKLRLQNRIGRSIATLPVVSLLVLAVWWLPQGGYSHDYAVSLVLVMLAAYVIAETNNTNMLIRTRSRMIASVWVFSMACLTFLHPFSPSILATFCLAASFYLLFRTYQQAEPVVDVFHTFVMLSLGSIFFPWMIYFVPFFLWHLAVFMRAMTLRTFFAALVGALLPFWFWSGWLFWNGDLTPLFSWYSEALSVTWVWQQEALLSLPLTFPRLAFLVFSVFALWVSVAYMLHSYDDKIRTRMMLYVYVFQTLLLVVFGFLSFSDDLLLGLVPMLVLCASPLLAHYFTLTTTWFSLIVFFLFLFCFLALGLLTLRLEAFNMINFVNHALHVR